MARLLISPEQLIDFSLRKPFADFTNSALFEYTKLLFRLLHFTAVAVWQFATTFCFARFQSVRTRAEAKGDTGRGCEAP